MKNYYFILLVFKMSKFPKVYLFPNKKINQYQIWKTYKSKNIIDKLA